MDLEKENCENDKGGPVSDKGGPRFFVRIGNGNHFLRIFKSITLTNSNIILFITGPSGVTMMCDNQNCVQGRLNPRGNFTCVFI